MRDKTNGKNNSEKLYTAQELAGKLHVSVSYAYELMQSGQIKHVKMGRLRRVTQGHIDDYLKKRTQKVLSKK